MRDAINRDEEQRLVAAVRAGQPWDEVRGLLHGVDPEALDRGFKARVLRAAGLESVFAEDLKHEVSQTSLKRPKGKATP
jgi:hypothetical protein